MEYTYKNLKTPASPAGPPAGRAGRQNPPARQRVRSQAKSGEKLKTIVVNAGEIVESPPMTMHAMRFLEDSIFIALTTEARDQKKYEKDTVRVKLI